MPRKSSFLQGFEVGSALYSRGYQQATQRRQMQLGEERDKRLEEQQKLDRVLKQDVHALNKQRVKLSIAAAQRENAADDLKLKQGKNDDAAVVDLVKNLGATGMNLNFSKAEDFEIAIENINSVQMELKTPNAIAKLATFRGQIERLKGGQLWKLANHQAALASNAAVESNLAEQKAFGQELKTWNFGTGMNIPQTPEGRAMMMHLKPLYRKAEVFAQAGELNMEGLEDLPADAYAKLESHLKDTIKLKTIGVDRAEAIRVKKVEQEKEMETWQAQLKNESEIRLLGARKILEGNVGKYSPEHQKILLDQGVAIRREKSIVAADQSQGQLSQMRDVLGSGRQSASDDLAQIFMFMKSLDPASVVREGEFANAQNAAGVPERISNAYNNLIDGVRLSPDQRKEFLATAESAVSGLQKRAHKVLDSYEGSLKEMGLPPHKFDEIRKLIGFSTHTFNTEQEFQNADREGWMPGDKFKYKDGAGNWQGGDVQGPEGGDPTGWTPEDEEDFRAEKANLAVASPAIRNQRAKVVGERISLGNISDKWKWHGTINAPALPGLAAVFEIVEAGRNGFKIKDASTGKFFYLPDNMIIQGGP